MITISGRDKFKKFSLGIRVLVNFFSIFPNRIHLFLFRKIKNWRGTKGVLFRYVFLKVLCKECGDNVYLDHGVEIKNIENLSLGNNISIHQMTYIDSIGGITIGNDVSIAHSCSLISFNHTWNNNTQPIKYNELVLEAINISSDVWIASGVRVLAGANIETRTIVGANAVVTSKKYEKNSILAGVPAKVIKKIE